MKDNVIILYFNNFRSELSYVPRYYILNTRLEWEESNTFTFYLTTVLLLSLPIGSTYITFPQIKNELYTLFNPFGSTSH